MSATEERRWLRDVLERLPSGDCAGCHLCASRCAGEVRMTRTEAESIREFLGGCEPFPAVRGNGQMAEPCGFRQPSGTGCIIYPVRPLICRLFGLVEWLPCPIGRAPLLIDDGPHIMRQCAQFELRTYRQWRRPPQLPLASGALALRQGES